jgi:5-bromo-4-chloroindolyl phosphate hydrolysis protein
MLQAEREAPDLTRLDTQTIAVARDEMERLVQAVRQDPRLLERYDAIEDHLGTLATFRTKKMMMMVGSGRPENATEEETIFYTTLESLVATMRRAWGLPE